MLGELSIRPSKDIRTNYAQISKLAHKNPVAITVNGREDTVLLSHEDFMQMQAEIAEYKFKKELYARLAKAEDDIKNGKVRPMSDAIKSILAELDDLDI